jgi:integrase
MKRNLTKAIIEGLEPVAGKRLEVFDSKQQGLLIRVTSRSRTWCCRCTVDGRRSVVRLGEFPALTAAGARTEAQRVRLGALNGVDRNQERRARRGRVTFADLLDEYEAEHCAKLKSGHKVMRSLRNELDSWIRQPVASFTRRDGVLIIQRVSKRAPVTANRLQAYLVHLLGYAANAGHIDDSPLHRLPKKNTEVKRERVLSDEEIHDFWHYEDQGSVANCLRFILVTGVRADAASGARWEEMAGDVWTVPPSRNKQRSDRDQRAHGVPLSPVVMALLAGRSRASPWVFRSERTNSRLRVDSLSQHLVRRGVTYTPHDLRRTVRTRLAALGVQPHIGEVVLGHVLPGVLGVYDRHSYLEEKRAALSLLSEHIAWVVGVAVSGNPEVMRHG